MARSSTGCARASTKASSSATPTPRPPAAAASPSPSDAEVRAMALLQIAEPGRAAAPHRHRLAVGIDLGTTNSLVATVRSAVPTVLADERGRPLLPSVVHYGEDGSLAIGHEARAHAAADPRNTVA